MRARVAAVVAVLVFGGVFAACVSLKRSPDSLLFVLRSLAEPPREPATAVSTSGVVGIAAVRLPDYLERPQVVTWRAPNEVAVDEFARWAEPLDAGIARIVRENLAILLPEHRIVGRPWAGDLDLDCRVVVEMSVFGMQGDGSVVLRGRFTLLPGRGERPFTIHPVDLVRRPRAVTGLAPAEGVDEMSALLGDLSRQIAEAVRARPVSAPGSEPSS